MLSGAAAWVYRHTRSMNWGMNKSRILRIATLVCLLLLPLALNVHGEIWTAFLKKLPLFKSSSTLVRWYAVYIPVITVATALALDGLGIRKSWSSVLAGFGVMVVVYLNAQGFDAHYRNQSYDPKRILSASAALRSGAPVPKVNSITFYNNEIRRGIGQYGRNEDLAQGGSQMLCAEPLFGYNLEHFPRQTLEPGPVSRIIDGRYNLKNPACYIYPRGNNCLKGDQFTLEQESDALAFAAYRPFGWVRPIQQRIAELLSLLSFIGAIGVLVLASRPVK